MRFTIAAAVACLSALVNGDKSA